MDTWKLPKGLPENAQKDINRTLNRQKLISEIEHELRTHPRYKEFFDRYHPKSVEIFIHNFTLQKANWIEFGEMYSRMQEERALKYSEIAYKKLWEIQQKKLFNLQCQWRAEQIELPGIVLTFDFLRLERMITECPFISQITEDEYELYRDFILSGDFEIESFFDNRWQDYEEYKQEYNDASKGSSIPEWYEYYDGRMGTETLMTLPDIRGEREMFYINLQREEEKKDNPAKFSPKENPDKRPYLFHYDDKVVEKFVENLEDARVNQYYRAHKENEKINVYYDDELNEAIETLKEAGNIEFDYSGNWRDSVLTTAKNYKIRCVYNAFETAYKNYLNRLQMGIGFEPLYSKDDIDFIESIIDSYRNKILQGRILNGEPADFNF